MDTNGNSSDKNVVINELAREDFYFFCRYMFRKQYGYKWQQAPHHEIICHQLMRVFRGECTRLILNLPPRYSKTQLMIYFIAWSLGRHPDSEFILTSYSARLCGNNSWQVRNIIGMDAYKAIFPKVTLQHDSKAKDEWRTTASGLVYAAGSGGAITGRGAGKIRDGFGGAIIVDDPLKPNEAHSELIRNGVTEWYLGTLAYRTNNQGKTPIIFIMQRLNENDLSGFLLSGVGVELAPADRRYAYTATTTGNATLTTCGLLTSSTFDTRSAAYAGAGCPSGAPVACNDDMGASSSQSGLESSISLPMVAKGPL